ncbi:MAG: calcium:proton antiporter [Hyphomicrobiaceae bacterium]|nr:calcium:proton antiporter [Hyphomicrobiaceae bacterium]
MEPRCNGGLRGGHHVHEAEPPIAMSSPHLSLAWKKETSMLLAAGLLIVLGVLRWIGGNGLFVSSGFRIVGFVILVTMILLLAFRALAHANVLGERFGEPYGTMLLTFSILSIELSLVISVMVTGSPDPTMARDTMFAGFMLTMNGVVGVVLLAGGLKHREQEFNLEGARAYLGALVPLAVITLVLPNFTRAGKGMLTDVQAVSVGIATVLFYAIFLGVQTMRHRDYFIAAPGHGSKPGQTHAHGNSEAAQTSNTHHFVLLFAALVLIALLGKELAAIVDYAIHRLGIPSALGGVLIATIMLAPESVSAYRAALDDHLQHSVNVFLGGALATIGLTAPCALLIGLWIERPIVLGLQGTDLVLLILTLFVSSLTFGGVRTNVLQGAVHLLLFAMYVILIISP